MGFCQGFAWFMRHVCSGKGALVLAGKGWVLGLGILQASELLKAAGLEAMFLASIS